MVKCPNCGVEVAEGVYFCPNCGAAIGAPPTESPSPSDIRKMVESRLNAIKNQDEGMLEDIVDESAYSKFDDWPPFTRQDAKDALNNERGAYKVLRKYEYEIKDYREDVASDSAVATFHISYRGAMRDRDFDVNSRVTIVLRRKGQSWKVVHEHWSRFPETRQRRGLFG